MKRPEIVLRINECLHLFDDGKEDDWDFSAVTDLNGRHLGFLVRYPSINNNKEPRTFYDQDFTSTSSNNVLKGDKG